MTTTSIDKEPGQLGGARNAKHTRRRLRALNKQEQQQKLKSGQSKSRRRLGTRANQMQQKGGNSQVETPFEEPNIFGTKENPPGKEESNELMLEPLHEDLAGVREQLAKKKKRKTAVAPRGASVASQKASKGTSGYPEDQGDNGIYQASTPPQRASDMLSHHDRKSTAWVEPPRGRVLQSTSVAPRGAPLPELPPKYVELQMASAAPPVPPRRASVATQEGTQRASVAPSDSDVIANLDTQFENVQAHSKQPLVNPTCPGKPKNRFGNIFSLPNSQVWIRHATPEKTKCDTKYINASYINLPEPYPKKTANPTLKYIATQGPLPETIPDFWQMIWEQNTNVICMLTNLLENGRLKCAPYMNFNDDKVMTTGEYTIITQQIDYLNDDDTPADQWEHSIEIRDVKLTNTTGKSRDVKHIWYTAWPDHDVPDSSNGALLVSKLVDEYKGNALPVIHCSAGVGRTGTLIAINYILNSGKINENTYYNRVSTVKKSNQEIVHNALSELLYNAMSTMREQRTEMIQSKEQYNFVYNAVKHFYGQTYKQPAINATVLLPLSPPHRSGTPPLPPLPSSAKPSSTRPLVLRTTTGIKKPDNYLHKYVVEDNTIYVFQSSNVKKKITPYECSYDNISIKSDHFAIINDVLFTRESFVDLSKCTNCIVDIQNMKYADKKLEDLTHDYDTRAAAIDKAKILILQSIETGNITIGSYTYTFRGDPMEDLKINCEKVQIHSTSKKTTKKKSKNASPTKPKKCSLFKRLMGKCKTTYQVNPQ